MNLEAPLPSDALPALRNGEHLVAAPHAGDSDLGRGAVAADLERARATVAEEVLPATEIFREFMLEQNRKLEVTSYLDHIEGPQVVVKIARKDGQIAATLNVEVTDAGIRPFWDAQSTGRFKTRWTETVRGGLEGLTRDAVVAKLTEFYLTDFS